MGLVEMVLFKHLDFVICNGLHLIVLAWSSAAVVSTAVNIASCSFIADEAYLILAAYPRGSCVTQCSEVTRFCLGA